MEGKLEGPSIGSTRHETKTACSRARIDLFAFNSLAAWERKRIRFNGDISTVRFYIYCWVSDPFRFYIYRRASDRSGIFGTRPCSNYERACQDRGRSFRFCFRVHKFVYQVKKQSSTGNTVLLLPLTTKKQYHTALNPTNTKINNSTTVPLYMTPTYNSKTAIQYHMIYNNCLLFPLLAKHPFPFLPEIRTLRQVANKLHGYIYSALATYFYAGIYLHADINGHLLRRYNLVP